LKIFVLYKIFTASDFVYDLKKNIFKCKHSLQLFLTEFDFLAISKEVLELLSNDISIDIVISSINQRKSLRMVNLFNRIVQSGGSVYWNEDADLYQNEVHFMILDKTFVINKSDYYAGESPEEKIKYLTNLFDGFRLNAEEIKLKTGEISIKLEADQTFVTKNNYVNIIWKVENAHKVTINKIGDDDLEHQGEMELLIKEDTILRLEAENRENKLSKQLIIKVLKSSSVEISVEALDDEIGEYLMLKGSGSEKDNYYAFNMQKIRISWCIETMGNFSESILGQLPLEGEHEFFLTHKTNFRFNYESIYGTQKNSIVIIPVTEKKEELEDQQKESPSKFSLVKVFSKFRKKLRG